MLGAQLTNDFGGFPNEMWNGSFTTEISKQGSKNKFCAKSQISKENKNISLAALNLTGSGCRVALGFSFHTKFDIMADKSHDSQVSVTADYILIYFTSMRFR